jgi:hypothetical protein
MQIPVILLAVALSAATELPPETDRPTVVESSTEPETAPVTPLVPLAQRYVESQPYATQIILSPTAFLVPPGAVRFGITEIALQQLNVGLNDRLQVGVNTTFLVMLSGDIKVRLTPTAARVQAAVLAGAGLLTLKFDQAAVYSRLAVSGLIEQKGRPGIWNLTLSAASAGSWLASETEKMASDAHLAATDPGAPPQTVTVREPPTIFAADQSYLLGTMGFDVPLTRQHWSLIAEADWAVPFEIADHDSILRGVGIGGRYARNTLGLQFGLAIPLMRKSLENRVLGLPFFDVTWIF